MKTKIELWILKMLHKHNVLELRSYKSPATLELVIEVHFLGKLINTVKWSELEKFKLYDYETKKNIHRF